MKRLLSLLTATAVMLSASVTAAASQSAGRPAPNAAATAASTPLPATQFEFGVANAPGNVSWMTGSGAAWKYRYQYLSAGVNTGVGWETWNSPAGQFALNYMNESDANGYVPVFTYYEICQSAPAQCPVGQDEQSDYTNINTASTMNSYFANFKLLMQKAATFGKKVVIHVEPDFWGAMQQKANGGDASTVSAKVNSSGFAEAAGFPDTVQGMAYVLLKLRDTYAQNAVLAIHASPWASGIDIASDTSSSINAAAEADKTAAFLGSAGIAAHSGSSTWDVVFSDVADRDAGFYEFQYGLNRWWDKTNTTFPNFNRYLAWQHEIYARTNRQQVVWQVPIGNQYFDTVNNTWGHYQDNRAEYFLGHVSDLAAAGLVAVLFGGGAGGTTSNEDADGDNVPTNPAPISDSWGACVLCNNHVSTSTDDDGGYLRMAVAQYYASPYPLVGCPTPPTPAAGVFHAVTPVRVLDTRNMPSLGAPVGAYSTPFGANTPRGVVIPGLPAGVTAVVLNVTATDTTAPSYLTVWPTGTRPTASNLNWVPGQTVPNLVYAQLGPANTVQMYNQSGSVDVVADLEGYFTSVTPPVSGAGKFLPQPPGRILETRPWLGGSGALTAGETRPLHVAPAGTSAAVLNFTVTDTTSSGYLTVYPGAVRPTASNLNWGPGQTIANRVTVQLDASGNVNIYNSSGTTDVVVDLNGTFTGSSGTLSQGKLFYAVPPCRVLDTRNSGGRFNGVRVPPAAVNSQGGVPASPAAVVLNATATDTTAPSYLTVWPNTVSQPLASDLNWVSGATVPNLVVVQTIDGTVNLYNNQGLTDVVLDVVGYFN